MLSLTQHKRILIADLHYSIFKICFTVSTSTDSTKYFTLIERLVFIVIQEVYHAHRLYIDRHVHLHECHESG